MRVVTREVCREYEDSRCLTIQQKIEVSPKKLERTRGGDYEETSC